MERMYRIANARTLWLTVFVLAASATSLPALAQPVDETESFIFGVKIRAGGRYDNVRACAASPAGTKGGPAADISVFTEIGLADNVSLHVDLPVFRPIMFGIAFKMLQFEPTVSLRFRKVTDGTVDFVGGPALGVSLHYGPDYTSEVSGDTVKPAFFAMGPIVGGYLGVDFKRPGKSFNFELGLSPYVTPLIGVRDSEAHRGVVIGGLLDGAFKFAP